MLFQHTAPDQIAVPLALPGWQIREQRCLADGTLEIDLVSQALRACCPRCQHWSHKVHDTRRRRKADRPLGPHRIVLILYKRRFRCTVCQRPFTEPDHICGWRRRTTARLRQQIGKQASHQPIAHVAQTYQVGPRFVTACWEQVVQARVGRSLAETAPLPTPRWLGIDEFARRKGRRYDTISVTWTTAKSSTSAPDGRWSTPAGCWNAWRRLNGWKR